MEPERAISKHRSMELSWVHWKFTVNAAAFWPVREGEEWRHWEEHVSPLCSSSGPQLLHLLLPLLAASLERYW